jgi:signal transduction histidine kinase
MKRLYKNLFLILVFISCSISTILTFSYIWVSSNNLKQTMEKSYEFAVGNLANEISSDLKVSNIHSVYATTKKASVFIETTYLEVTSLDGESVVYFGKNDNSGFRKRRKISYEGGTIGYITYSYIPPVYEITNKDILFLVLIWIVIILICGLTYTFFLRNSKNLKNLLYDLKSMDTSVIDKIAFRKLNGNSSGELHDIQNNILIILEKLKTSLKKAADKKKEESLGLLASQVAHDIRSPLAALNMITGELDDLPETTRIMLRGSINRIQDIANNLLQNKKKGNAEQVSIYLISPVIEEIISEKRTQLRSKQKVDLIFIKGNDYGLFARFDQSHLKRMLSNIINNSVEAFDDRVGEITVSLKKLDNQVKVILADNGKGVPAHIIKQLGGRGASFGKEDSSESGSGLGIYHAKTSIESWGGSFGISSQEGEGTQITLSLPVVETPSWFTENLNLNKNQKIVVIDDDKTIHQVWNTKLGDIASKNNISIIHFSNPHELRNWIKGNRIDNTLFLCDYEFIGHTANGLNLIEESGISEKSILVTSRFEEENVRTRCDTLRVKLIPKSMAETVPVDIVSCSLSDVDLVHIDDDELIRMSWEFGAKKENKKILSFVGPDDLRAKLSDIPKATPFYIDSSLGENIIAGQDLALELHDLGYKNLVMSTGYEKDTFDNMPWIKAVIGKEAPWM